MTRPRLQLLVLLMPLALSVAGCYRWELVTAVSPREVLTETDPVQIRVLVRDEPRTLTLGDLFLLPSDSIRGTMRDEARTVRTLAVEDILGIEVRHFDALVTSAVVLSAVTSLIMAVKLATCDDPRPTWGAGC